MSDRLLNLTRNQLGAMTPNARALRALEQVIKKVPIIEELTVTGSNAQTSATQALDTINAFQNTLSIAASQPIVQQNNFVKSDYVDISITSPKINNAVGRIQWDDATGTLEFLVKGGNVVLPIGEKNILRIKNDDTVLLLPGDVVYVYGSDGINFTVKRAQADNKPISDLTIGVVAESISVGELGFIVLSGIVDNINTSAFVPGDILYLSGVSAGELTNIRPTAPIAPVRAGVCLEQSAATGKVFISIEHSASLGELQNVLFSSVENGNTLVFDSVAQIWKNEPLFSSPAVKTADFIVAANDVWLINNKSASTCTVTLPVAANYTGRVLRFQNWQSQSLISSSSNIVPLVGGAAATAILPATSGAWATLVSDGTNWLITQAG